MRRKAIAAALVIFLALSWGAANGAVPKLSRVERQKRIGLLPPEEKEWLEVFVGPIILPDEENLFLLLSEPHQREIFKAEFWKRREADGLLFPLGPGYRRRYEDLLRVADEKYDGRRQDAGRMVVTHGEPASIQALEDCRDMFRDLEIWTYRGPSAGNRGELQYFFYRRSPQAPRKLWDVTVPDSDVFQPGSCRKHFADLYIDCTPAERRPGIDPCYLLTNCKAVCGILRTYLEIKTRAGSALGGREESASALAPPAVNLEGLDSLAARFPGLADPNARPLAIEAGSRAPGVAMTPSPGPSPIASLSPEEIRERILRLEPKYREWVYLAAPLLVGDELSRFLQMSDSRKDEFIRAFWRRQSR